jgi:Protein of unknown function (DUF1573)
MSFSPRIALFLLLLQPAFATDETVYSFFSPTHGKLESHAIPITNSGSIPIADIKAQADCGCIRIETFPKTIKAGETESIVFSIMQPGQDERKINTIAIEGKPDFRESIKVVNYFYSEVPQIFGQTVVHLPELPTPPPLITALIIGDNTINALSVKVEPDNQPGIRPVLADAAEFKGQSGCFKRILKIKLDPAALMRANKEMIYIRASEKGKQIVISAE